MPLEEEDLDFFLDRFLRRLRLDDESDEEEELLLLDEDELEVEGDRRRLFLDRRRSLEDFLPLRPRSLSLSRRLRFFSPSLSLSLWDLSPSLSFLPSRSFRFLSPPSRSLLFSFS